MERPGFEPGLLNNLWSGTKFALFRPVVESDFVFGLRQIVLFLFLEVAIVFVYDYATTGPNPAFNIYGVMDIATGYLLFFLSLYAISRAVDKTYAMHKLLLVLLATSPLVWLVYFWTISYADNPALGWAVWAIYVGWGCLIVFRACGLVFGVSKQQAIGFAAIFVLINHVPVFFLPHEGLWYSLDDAGLSDGNNERVNVEDTYYGQQALLDTIQLKAERAGVVDLYFVGFGNYAHQDVFLKEVRFVKDLFDRKFDTEGRSVVLINNEQTIEDIPLATAHNLREVLARVARKMNVDEDILFLFLTSHGSEDAELAAAFWPLQPNDLEAGQLRDILDESGIKWRVVVVSACYSGTFIEPLKNDNSLLITASAEDKQSFGCSSTRDFTYFGEAYFRQALSATDSWIEAFNAAKHTVEQREQQEDKTPSEPQIYIGNAIEPRLALLHERMSSQR